MLLRRDAFAAAGGFAPIRGAVIDDCALARLMKARGPIWLGLTERAEQYVQRGYTPAMGARSAARFAPYGMPFARVPKPRVSATSPASIWAWAAVT